MHKIFTLNFIFKTPVSQNPHNHDLFALHSNFLGVCFQSWAVLQKPQQRVSPKLNKDVNVSENLSRLNDFAVPTVALIGGYDPSIQSMSKPGIKVNPISNLFSIINSLSKRILKYILYLDCRIR